MKKTILLAAIVAILIPAAGNGEDPVLVADYTVDTSLYEADMTYHFRYAPGPLLTYNEQRSSNIPSVFVWAYLKKNSGEVDIYSYAGKCGTSVFPVLGTEERLRVAIFLSMTFVDSDPQWEAIIRFGDGRFALYDHDGREMLRDSGDAGYGFDGSTTYLIVNKRLDWTYGLKTWRLRTNVSSAAAPSTAKRRSAGPGMMQIYGINDNTYRVTLAPPSGGTQLFEVFDLLGRCLLTKTITNHTAPVSFIIPEEEVPITPFIAKTTEGGTAEVKKVIPAR